MNALKRFQSWNRMRAAIKRVEYENDPAAAEALLRQYPSEADQLAERATAMADNVAPWYALLIAVALARHDAPQTVSLLSRLAQRDFPGWHRLDEAAITSLQRYLLDRGEGELLNAIRRRLNERQLAWVVPDVAAADFVDAFAAVNSEQLVVDLARRVAAFVEEIGLGKQFGGHGLDNAIGVAAILWKRGRVEEALKLLAWAAVAEPSLFEDQALLRPIAKALPGWLPRNGSLRLEGLPEKLELDLSLLQSVSVPPRVVRAADLLGDFPAADWIDPLRLAWCAMDDLVRCDFQDRELKRDPLLLMAAQSIAGALGSCAAQERQISGLVRDEAARTSIYEGLGREIDQRNVMVHNYRKLVERHQSGDNHVESIRKLQDQIVACDQEIARKREALREHMTPVGLLLHVVADEQAYPLEVRQAAAWGLHRVLTTGALDEATRARVTDTLRALVHDRKLDESALRDQIAAMLPAGDARVRELLAAAERYAADRDGERLATTVDKVAPEVPSLADEISNGVDVTPKSRGEGQFGERLLRLLPNAGLLEFLGALRRGLAWMRELVEGRTEGNPACEENLREIVSLIGAELPGVTDFLSKYPLRLMTLDRHRHVLGQYTREKAGVELWTRYTPPRWFRGVKPEELGQVHRRYLELEDRSRPNAMGLYYRLFEHPLLVLPVLYHEFMHYGGPEGDAKKGIENETEVLLREILFARYLIARLAPANEDEIPEYEEGVVTAIEQTELLGLAQQLFFDFENDESLDGINEQIVRIYGNGLDGAAAKAQADKIIERWNRTIELANQVDESKQAWCPEIDWPRLGSLQTHALTDHFREVLSRSLQQNHRLTTERRDNVLQEPICQQHSEDWRNYRQRDGALHQFQQFTLGKVDTQSLRTIVQRFQFERNDAVIAEILRLSRMFSGTSADAV